YGVFLSFDLFLLFVFYELAIIPKYFLIAIWGSTRKEYGAMKLALYSFVGSAMVLIGLIAAYVIAGAKTMSLVELAKFPFPHDFQMWAFPLVFVGFAILAGLWPFHTWAPTGHVAAPTAASMVLAGVVMKLGAYGAVRVAVVLFSEGLKVWQQFFAALAWIAIIYAAAVALTRIAFLIGVGFMLRALQKTFYADAVAMTGEQVELAPISAAEKAGAILLLAPSIVVGLYPRLIFDLVGPALQQPLFRTIASTF